MQQSLPAMGAIATLTVVWIAAWVDFRTFKIPNPVSVSGAALGLAVNAWDSGLAGLWQSVAGLGLGMLLLLPGYALQSTGAGDVKLIGALGALLGPQRLLWALLLAVLAAAVMGILYALAAWRTRGATGPLQRYGGMLRFLWVTGRLSYVRPRPGEAMAQRMPLAVPIAIGTTAALLWPL